MLELFRSKCWFYRIRDFGAIALVGNEILKEIDYAYLPF